MRILCAATMKSCAFLLLIVGCHDSSSKPGSKSEPGAAGVASKKPCEYMARADAEAAIEIELPGTNENVTLGQCGYTSPEFYGASLTVGDWDSIKTAAAGRSTAISGLGDEALSKGGGLIYVRKGDRGFLLSINGPVVDHSADKGLAKAKTLALTILTKM
jgi:hypothetical protein